MWCIRSLSRRKSTYRWCYARRYVHYNVPDEKQELVTHGLTMVAYDSTVIEKYWYDWWCTNGLHSPQSSNKHTNIKCMILPPPNVTGALHIGHALTNAIQDAFVRYERMCGTCIQWMPGLDHAGIATQSVVEKHLWKSERVTRHELGRDAFVERVWDWKRDYGDRINDQQKKLGSSLDWNCEYFTMDAQRSTAVTEAFVRLYDAGYVERGLRMINWDCHLATTISDIEVDTLEIEPHAMLQLPGREHQVEFGVLHHMAYKVDDDSVVGKREEVVVSTTRLETMFGDVAVAVHPQDQRYAHLHNKYLVQPITNRRIPIIVDSGLVDPTLGSGAVKVTPAHDINDYECGKRHSLQIVQCIDDDGKLNDTACEFAGHDRFSVRELLVDKLTELGAYRGADGHASRLAICSRSGDVLEPMVKPQWFVKVDEMASKSRAVVSSGRLQLWPLNGVHERLWNEFLRNSTDWCVSRQLWWGHRIPAYQVVWHQRDVCTTSNDDKSDATGECEWVVARTMSEATEKVMRKHALNDASGFELRQDQDVLDTWFSSGLLPMSCRGWPEKDKVEPLVLMETGKDILFFWVARMVMLSLALNGDQLPFERVYLHPMVCDAQGKKMSKSRGNVIDPMDVINGVTLEALLCRLESGNLAVSEVARAGELLKREFPNGIPQCGADALRFTLCNYARGGQTIAFDYRRVHHFRLFCNKMYQACRYVISKCSDLDMLLVGRTGFVDGHSDHPFNNNDTSNVVNVWIVSRLARCVVECDRAFQSMDLALATDTLHQFFQHEFCDEYIEYSKALCHSDDADMVSETKRTLVLVMETCLRLFHPFMPFLTEELWQALIHRCMGVSATTTTTTTTRLSSIVCAPYPRATHASRWINRECELLMLQVSSIIGGVREMRASHGDIVDARAVLLHGVDAAEFLSTNVRHILLSTLRLHSVSIVPSKDNAAMWKEVGDRRNLSVGVRVVNVEAASASLDRINKKIRKLQGAYEKQLKVMQAPSYATRVPEKVQSSHSQRLAKIQGDMEVLRHSHDMLKGIVDSDKQIV